MTAVTLAAGASSSYSGRGSGSASMMGADFLSSTLRLVAMGMRLGGEPGGAGVHFTVYCDCDSTCCAFMGTLSTQGAFEASWPLPRIGLLECLNMPNQLISNQLLPDQLEQPDLELMLRGRPLELPNVRVQIVPPASGDGPRRGSLFAVLRRHHEALALFLIAGALVGLG